MAIFVCDRCGAKLEYEGEITHICPDLLEKMNRNYIRFLLGQIEDNTNRLRKALGELEI